MKCPRCGYDPIVDDTRRERQSARGLLLYIVDGFVWFFGTLMGLPSVIDRPLPARKLKPTLDVAAQLEQSHDDDARRDAQSMAGRFAGAYGDDPEAYIENERNSWERDQA
jgi:hypothetical protein